MFNETPQYGMDSPEYQATDDSPEYQATDDSPGFKISTPDKDGQGIKLNIQENLSSVKDTILDIIDVGKRSILDIDKETDAPGKSDGGKSSENSKPVGETKIISTDLVDKMGQNWININIKIPLYNK